MTAFKTVKTLCAPLSLALMLVGAAAAQDHGRHGGGRDRSGGGHEGYAAREFGGSPGPGRPPIEMGGAARGAFAPRGYGPPAYSGYANRYGPPVYTPQGAGSWRRGQFLPHAYWSGEVTDLRRYRLRTPPPGYGWYGVGRDAYLVQRSTGLILDTIPGAW